MREDIRQKLETDFKGKKVLIVGLGLQGGGIGLTRFLSKIGAIVTATDLRDEKELSLSIGVLKGSDVIYKLGRHDTDDFLNSDFIFKGPSVPWDLPQILEAQKKGVRVDMEISYLATFLSKQMIGITGTRGKSTTTQMIFEILQSAGKDVLLGGNVRNISTIELLPEMSEKSILLLELSSWQLSGFKRHKVSPHISVFTSLYPDHLNYYKTMDEYFSDKAAIFQFQNENDVLIAHESLKGRMNELKSKVTFYSVYDGNLLIRGRHNKENAAAAKLVAKSLGVEEAQIQSVLSQFKGIPYRQESVRKTGEIEFINDTTSTTPVSTMKAVETFGDNPTALIIGGTSKKLPYDELIGALDKVKKIILLKGTFTDEIEDKLRKQYGEKVGKTHDNLPDAVNEAYEQVRNEKKAFVLFSPGAASFGMFRNEFHRGEEFNKIVQDLP